MGSNFCRRVGLFGLVFMAAHGDSLAAQLPDDLELFDWRCAIHGSFETGRIYRARITPEIFDGFRSFPLDLRLIDKDGTNWPSMVWSRSDSSSVVPVKFVPFDPAPVSGSEPFVSREFQIESLAEGAIPAHNRIIIQSGSREQVRRVEVWGGLVRDKLELLGSGFLVEQKLPAPVRNRTIDYADSRVPFISVRVFPDTRQSDTTLEWRSTEIARAEYDDSDHESVELEKMDAPDNEPSVDGVTTLYLDAGARNRPLLYVSFSSDASDNAIPMRIFGRNASTNKWRWVADAGIHQLDGHERIRVPLAKADYRYLKVEFHHYGQKPPRIKHLAAAAMPHYLVFEARSNQKPYLFFGAPRYDLNMGYMLRRVDPASLSNEPDASFSRRQPNPMRVAGTLSDYRNTLMRLGLGVVVLLVAIFGVRILRRRYF